MRWRWSASLMVVAGLGASLWLVWSGPGPAAFVAVLALAVLAVILLLREGGGWATADRLRAELRREQRQLREAHERARAAAAHETDAVRTEATLREARAEAERLRPELERARRQLAEAEERVRTMTAAAVEERRQLAAAAERSRQEVERLRPEVARLRAELEGLRRGPAEEPRALATPPAAGGDQEPPAAPAPAGAGFGAAPPAAAPAAAPAGPAVPAAGREGDTAPAPPAEPATETLLLVDDDDEFRLAAVDILGQAGYQVLEAPDGAAALDRVRRHAGPIDLLITDVVMPGMNGRHLAQRFTVLRPGVRVLYISGIVDEMSAREAIAGEDADFLAKPFDAAALRGKVRALLRGSARR